MNVSNDQPDIVEPKVEIGAIVWLAIEDSYRQGNIVGIKGDIATVDFIDWIQEYPVRNIRVVVEQELAWFGPVLMPNVTGRCVADFGLATAA